MESLASEITHKDRAETLEDDMASLSQQWQLLAVLIQLPGSRSWAPPVGDLIDTACRHVLVQVSYFLSRKSDQLEVTRYDHSDSQ